MRIRKKPWVREELANCDFFIENPTENIGKWKNKFCKKNPIHIELGCGKGTFIANLAYNNKNINYIAIDIKSEVLGLAKRNIEKTYLTGNMPITNILIFSYEIMIIKDIFNKKDKIDRIYINFCNPWPKSKHYKRRLTHINQLEQYKNFLSKNGEIYFKTDDDDLFNSSIRYFKEAGFTIKKLTYNLHEEDIFLGNIITEHEKMFSKQGIKIKALIAYINDKIN